MCNLKQSDTFIGELHSSTVFHGVSIQWLLFNGSVLDPGFTYDVIKSRKGTKPYQFVTESFNKCVDGSTVSDVDLKKNIKQQFRDNCFEYLLRSVYVRYNTPSAERDNLVYAIFGHALKTSDGSEPRPLK